jgi:serine/threonine-protein kinase
MALTPGTRLGTYEILAPLGAGGMGEVYQARDTKLGREVAIKVLPEAFSQDEERLARFEREARLLASLNHPNIATLYGLEQQGGVEFLVMELVPGETLDEVISKRGAALLEDSLPLFRQIAEGLEAAHERGIVHRDLKPANVKVTPEGKVKILDFGLAKAFADEVAPTDLSQSPTVTREGTAAGVIMGTAAYMSPEQARGKPLDKRTDIWSFGCVMFEGLTGAKSFKGETVSDVLAAVLRADPDLNALPPSTPVNVRWLLRRCLQKDPHHRLHDIADARVEIEEAIREPSASTTGLASDRRARWGRAVPWGVSLLALALGTWGLMRPTPSSVPLRRFLVEPPSPQLLGPAPAIALSQSGNVLVYLALTRNDDRLYLRALDRFEAQPIAGTEGARFPFLSPDGEWVGFRVGQKLKKVPSGGGLPVDICDVVDARGASWGPDDWIYYGNASNGLWRVSADGGEPEVVTELDKELGEWTHRFPDVLPGGEAVLFTLGDRSMTGSWDEGNIGVVTVETGQRRTLVKGGMFGRYFEGHLLYVRGGQLMAAPFDRGRLEVTGQAVKVLEDIRSYPAGAAAQLAAAGVGVLAYASGGAQGEEPTQLLWVDRQGNRAPVMDEARAFRQPALSPDGQKLAVVIVRGGNSDLWLPCGGRSTPAGMDTGWKACELPLCHGSAVADTVGTGRWEWRARTNS